jgi:hypothetical protein
MSQIDDLLKIFTKCSGLLGDYNQKKTFVTNERKLIFLEKKIFSKFLGSHGAKTTRNFSYPIPDSDSQWSI